jgi:hypothetical protein
MAYDAQDLRRLMQEFSGGSDKRYRHTFNRRFIYTEGVQAVAEAAGAYWLLDKVALELAPLYAKAWLEENASIGVVKFTVPKDGAGSRPVVVLSLADDAPPAYEQALDFTTFPEGEWVFFLGTDEVGPESYVTTMCLPQEY